MSLATMKVSMICLSFLYLCYQEEARLKKEAEERAERERAELEEATQRRHRQEEWVGVWGLSSAADNTQSVLSPKMRYIAR